MLSKKLLAMAGVGPLVSHLMNEGSGTAIGDTADGYTATMTNGSWSGGNPSFNGTTTFIETNSAGNVPMSNKAFTVQFDMNETDATGTQTPFARWNDNGVNQRMIIIQTSSGGVGQYLITYSTDGTDSATYSSGVTPITGSFVTVKLTYDGSNFRIYENNALKATSGTISTIFAATNAPVTLGIDNSRHAGTAFYKGTMRNFIIYNRVR